MPLVAPSVLAADFAHLADDLKSAESTGIQLFHLDIMDGHFVPNISYGPAIVKTIDGLTDLFLDCHLMLSEPEKYFDPFVKAGADNITFHLEVHPDPRGHAKRLHEMGIKAGISINPDMPVNKVLPFLEHFDYLLVMSVFPGFGGQKFIPSAIDKVAVAREHIRKNGLMTRIEVDGGVDESNAKTLADAGADILVMGTAFFKSADRKKLVADTQR
jgi:ribulose-phosphate 3-epimerase